jgi:hypothetical protein
VTAPSSPICPPSTPTRTAADSGELSWVRADAEQARADAATERAGDERRRETTANQRGAALRERERVARAVLAGRVQLLARCTSATVYRFSCDGNRTWDYASFADCIAAQVTHEQTCPRRHGRWTEHRATLLHPVLSVTENEALAATLVPAHAPGGAR